MCQAPHPMVVVETRGRKELCRGRGVRPNGGCRLGESNSEQEKGPTPKRRRVHRENTITTDDADEKELDYPKYTVARIIDRRGSKGTRQYSVQREDKMAEWK
uniref:Uncharacterized protein n=1 Tax=Peronospora matthiolae TaxID=2874970 RepID=A0AAV1TA61_9STRA